MKIVIPGEPIPQARMRHCSRGGFTRTYDPNAKHKEKVRQFLSTLQDIPPFEFPRISFLFHMPIPKSISKKQYNIYSTGRMKHVKKPDVDNLVKLHLDCLDGIVIFGDQKVSLGPCVKVYHTTPKTIIWITETTSTLTPAELDTVLDVSECAGLNSCELTFPLDS